MQLEPYICNLDPDTKTTLKMHLFENVQNIAEIRNKIQQGNWECAVIKANLILDPSQVAAAVNKAVVARMQSAMVTKTVYTECVYNLSIYKSITRSLCTFGVYNDNNILVCLLVTPEKDNSKEILDQIIGEECPISDLKKFCNTKDIKHVYKLNEYKYDKYLLDLIITMIAAKPVL